MGEIAYTFQRSGTKLSQKVAFPITEKDSLLEKVIAGEYECPVCLSFTYPPIMMCLNSHIICFNCWKKCTSCPTCRVAKTLTRAHTLEKIHPLITFPCRWEGCSFMASASYTGIHEHLCPNYPLKCPLADNHQCNWLGTMESVKTHLLEKHGDNVYFQPNVFLMSRCFTKSVKKNYTVIFVVHDRLFKFQWSFDKSRSSKVKFGMVSIGNGNPIIVYNYSVIFAKEFPIDRSTKMLKIIKSQIKKSFMDCSSVDWDPNTPAVDCASHEQDYGELVTFCNGSNLVYQVIIEVSHIAKYNKFSNIWTLQRSM